MTTETHNPPILVASDHQLVNKTFYRERVWLPARRAHQDLRSRTAWLHALTLIYDFDGAYRFRDGRAYNPPDVDDVFTDPENRWMSNFLKADDTGKGPASYSSHFERLRMIELYCQLVSREDWARL